MKKKKKTIILTLLVLAGLTGGAWYFFTNRGAGPSGEFQKRMEEEQRDITESRAYRYDFEKSAIPLATSGEEKNVLNFSNRTVYSVKQSNMDRERLDRVIKRADADFENPLIALNPFGTNPNSFYFYFNTSYRCMIRYTITVDDESIQDYIRYVSNGQEDNMAKTHEFVVSGLVPGKNNYIILEQFDGSGSRREAKTYKYTVPKASVPEHISVEPGYSKETSQAGLFCVFPKSGKRFYMYDNQGVLRNITETESGHNSRIYETGDSVIYGIGGNAFARVSALGRVLSVARATDCGEIEDYSYDGYDEVYVLGKKKKQFVLTATSLKTGKTRKVYSFPKGMQPVSLSQPQGGTTYVTVAKPSGLLCLNAITSAKPSIRFVMGNKKDWKKKVNKKKIVQDKETSTWTMGSSPVSSVNGNSLSLLVKKKGKTTGLNVQMDGKKKSCKIIATQTFEEPLSSLLQVQGEHMILTNPQTGVFSEYDKYGKVTRKFSYGNPVDSVEKILLKDMCFYNIVP